MGECGTDALRVDFDGCLKLEFHGSQGHAATRDCWPTGNSMMPWD